MGAFTEIVKAVNEDEERFSLIIEKMRPKINMLKYSLFKDDVEDSEAELIEALWKAYKKMEYLETDGQLVSYFEQALIMRFKELYRKSRQYHDNETSTSWDEDSGVYNKDFTEEDGYELADLRNNIDMIIESQCGIRKTILRMIVYDLLSDTEISKKLYVSRQYVNRVRRFLKELLTNQGYL